MEICWLTGMSDVGLSVAGLSMTLNHEIHRQPMKIYEYWHDVIVFAATKNDKRQCVLNALG